MYFQPLHHEVDLLILVNLKSLLPHKRQLQLINVDPELKAYPVLQIKHPRDLYLCIKDVKMHICDFLWETLSMSISSNEFRLTFDVSKNGKKYRHHLADDISVYQAIYNAIWSIRHPQFASLL